uniref:hypothetical protein n=1 Tax=Pedobacter schmidteae TaxID=2201271 RepID=UPI000EB5B7C7|nr:hypothetical protein [Pedobacter schmidteae]
MRSYVLLFLLFLSVSGYSQQSLNNYKYVLVPEKFSFLKEINQYKMNMLTKALLEEKGFTVYYDNAELPLEIANNKCSALVTDVTQRKSMFSTNLTLVLKDCQGNVVFQGKEGKSREKEFEASYKLALRDAFTSLNETEYAYNGTAHAARQTASQATGVTYDVTAAVQPAVAVSQPVAAGQPVTKPAVAEAGQASGTLYAQPTATGYQLIDTAPKIVLSLFKTSVADCFIANNSNNNGVVVKKGAEWFFEYYKEGKLIAEKLLIKF